MEKQELITLIENTLNSDKSSVAFIKLKHELYMDLFEHKLFKKSPEVFFLNYKHFTKFENRKIL